MNKDLLKNKKNILIAAVIVLAALVILKIVLPDGSQEAIEGLKSISAQCVTAYNEDRKEDGDRLYQEWSDFFRTTHEKSRRFSEKHAEEYEKVKIETEDKIFEAMAKCETRLEKRQKENR